MRESVNRVDAERQHEQSFVTDFERCFVINLNSNIWPAHPELKTLADYFHSVVASIQSRGIASKAEKKV